MCLSSAPSVADAQVQATATIAGTLIDQNGGLPIPGAIVDLFTAADRRAASTTTDANGAFAFASQAPGEYYVIVRASGYAGVRSSTIVAGPGATSTSRFALARSSGSEDSTTQVIGRVSATSGAAQSLQTSATITAGLDSQLLQTQGVIRAGDALQRLPGITTGTSSSVGDDLYLSIRGSKQSEVETLLDGHPIGPIGVTTDSNSGSKFQNGFNFAATPLSALRNVQVYYGTGALGIYGIDVTGGAVDFQTLEPTQNARFSLKQGFGNENHSLTSFTATGTLGGKLGYAFVHGVEGSQGQFAGQQITQTNLAGSDISSANLAANTYAVSGNTLLHTDLAKLRYNFTPTTSLLVSAFDAIAWADSTGNGDNDFVSYQQQLYNEQLNATPAAGCTAATPIALTTNSGSQCFTPQAAAQLTYGPAGGGAGRQRTTRLNDFHGRFSTAIGNNNISLDAFWNQYAFLKDSSISGGLDPTGSFYTGDNFQTRYRTQGYAITDDLVSSKNDLGFGYYVEHQLIDGSDFQPIAGGFGFISLGSFVTGSGNVFVRDTFNANDRTTIFLNAYLKKSTVTQQSNLIPRASVVYRFTPNDVGRISYGHALGEPAPQLLFGAPNISITPASVTAPPCLGLETAGSAPNPKLTPESSSDYEVAFGHRFNARTTVQLDAYRNNAQNVIFGGTLPLSAVGLALSPTLLAQLQAPYASCSNLPSGPTNAQFGVTSFFNAGAAVTQGFDVTGHIGYTRTLSSDFAVGVESSTRSGIPTEVLMSNPYFINGAQLPGIPLQKASVSLAYDSPGGAFEARIDSNFVSQNNSYNATGMGWADLGIVQHTKHVDLNLGVTNVFNSHAGQYGYIGLGLARPVNAFATQFTALDQGIELFTLPERTFLVSATIHT